MRYCKNIYFARDQTKPADVITSFKLISMLTGDATSYSYMKLVQYHVLIHLGLSTL